LGNANKGSGVDYLCILLNSYSSLIGCNDNTYF
jgi:hypothetical protein